MADNHELNLSSPWAIYFAKMSALFLHDDEVRIRLDADKPCVTLYVANAIKADALAQILPTEKTFGNVTLDISVVPENDVATTEQVMRWAFDGNPALVGVDIEELPDGTPVTFALFEPDVAQFFADDLTNPWGVQTMTYEQLANDVLSVDDIIITSDYMLCE